MTIDELLAKSPQEIFGEQALTNRKELRKRYAQLVKEFRPEESPAAFRWIRDAYESLSRGDQRSPEPTSPQLVHDQASTEEPVREIGTCPQSTWNQCMEVAQSSGVVAGLELFDQYENLLRSTNAEAWLEIMLDWVSIAAWDLPPARIEQAFRDLDDPSIGIDDDTYFSMSSQLCIAQSWQLAAVDNKIPKLFKDALLESRYGSRIELAKTWLDVVDQLGAERISETYLYIAQNHPGLIPVLSHIEDKLTGKHSFNSEWEDGLPEVHLYQKEPMDLHELDKLYFALRTNTESKWQKYWPFGFFGTCTIALIAFVGLEPWTAFLIKYLTILFVVRGYTILFRDPEKRLKKGFFKLIKQGLFRHEILAAVVGTRDEHREIGSFKYDERLLDPLTQLENDPPTDLSLWNKHHVQRVVEEEKKREASEAQGQNQTEAHTP